MKKGFEIKVYDDYEAMSRAAADFLIGKLKEKPDSLVAIATGSTPRRAYELLAEEHAVNPSLFARMRAVKLDEWGGVPLDSPVACETAIRKHVLEPLGIGDDRYITFGNEADSAESAMKELGRRLAELGGLDVCILGLGMDGHLALNEPAGYLELEPHVVRDLKEETLGHPMLAGAKVEFGLTLGMGDIFVAKTALLLVSGAAKRGIFAELKSGKISTQNPASLLWLHGEAVCFCDKESYEGEDR